MKPRSSSKTKAASWVAARMAAFSPSANATMDLCYDGFHDYSNSDSSPGEDRIARERDEVVKRMLATPPQPQPKSKAKKA